VLRTAMPDCLHEVQNVTWATELQGLGSPPAIHENRDAQIGETKSGRTRKAGRVTLSAPVFRIPRSAIRN
jgi:hypothetical protein